MKNTKLQIYPGKTIFHIQKIHFLRYIITNKRMKINFDKIKAICKWLTPILPKEILLFLKFTEFYQKFVKVYLEIITFFTKMIRKDIVFTWGSKKQKTFDTLKK